MPRLFSALTLSLFFTDLVGQDFLSQIRKRLEIDQRRNPAEKVYLHLDRPFYMTGESIYFSAYVTEGYQHKPSTLSNNVHVELILPDGTLFYRITIRAYEGKGSGHFDLADSMKTGAYQIRAYTSYMQNFDNDFIFQRTVRVYSLVENQQTALENAAPYPADIQFLPEGGGWLYGVDSRIAFKAVDQWGKGIEVQGRVYDDLQKEVAVFRSTHLGMGHVTLHAEQGRTYTAKIDGRTVPVALPAPAVTGYALQVINDVTQKGVKFKIRTPIRTIDNDVVVVVHCRGRIIFSSKVTLASGEINGSIPRTAFLTGINHITLFDRNQQPVAERLFYVDREDAVDVKSAISDTIAGKRKKVALDFVVRYANGTPAKAKLSVAATDDSQIVLNPNRETIASYLLLRSDLKGTVESPGYYSNASNHNRFEALDLVMLTHGWRRFVWERIINNEPVKITFPVEKGFPISGTMKRHYSEKGIPHGKVSFLAKDFKTVFGAIETNAAGCFRVSDIQVDGPAEILFQGHFKKEKRTDVWFDFDTVQVLARPGPGCRPPVEELGDFERAFINRGIARRNIDERYNVEKEVTLLEGIVITAKRIPTSVREKIVAGGHGWQRTITIEEGTWAQHPFQLLRNKATSIGDCLPYRPVRVYWNGVEIIHPSQLLSKDASMVAEIDTGCDLIAFWTRKGSFSNSATSFMLRGYQPIREFYSPKYNQPLPDHTKEDYRVTLEWQSGLETDEQGQSHFEFYTSDNATAITINCEGLTSTGMPVVFQRKVIVRE